MKKEDVRIVLDAGHGGEDGGATGNGIIEKDLTLAITLYMYDRLQELGIPVKITRTTDETLTPTERVNRVKNAWGSNKDVILISNHINSSSSHTADGAEVIYALRNTNELPNLILKELEKEGQNIRSAYQRRLPSDTSKDYYFMQRNTNPIHSLTVEYGFLDSNKDDPTQLKNNYKLYAEAVIRALFEYLDIPYTPLETNTYIVQKGDTLYKIALKYNTTIDLLKAENGLSNNSLKIGQMLKIPSPVEDPDNGDFLVYVVKSGDTLFSIANAYGTTVNALLSYNKLSNTNLTVGEQILIPRKDINKEDGEDILYTIQKGDSLWNIAQAYDTTVTELKNYNQLTSNTLSVGQVIKIPKGSTITPPNNQVDTLYVVQKGDSLWTIANTYGVTVTELKSENHLTNNLLIVGQTLVIPQTTSTTYVVKSGDSLWNVAKKYNTTVNEIKSKNNLTSNTLSIGQTLLL